MRARIVRRGAGLAPYSERREPRQAEGPQAPKPLHGHRHRQGRKRDDEGGYLQGRLRRRPRDAVLDAAHQRHCAHDQHHDERVQGRQHRAGEIPAARANGKIVQSNTPPVWTQPTKGVQTTAPVDESTYSATADTSSTYRWSATDQQYIYNWNTDKSQVGYYWRIGAKLDDGTTRTVDIGLR